MSDLPLHLPRPTDADTYDIVVRGHLDARWAARLNVPSLIHYPQGTTLLGGIAADQAALHGLLQRVRDLGLTLVSVVRISQPSSLSLNPPIDPEKSK